MDDELESLPSGGPRVNRDGAAETKRLRRELQWFCKRNVLNNFKVLDILCHLITVGLNVRSLLHDDCTALFGTRIEVPYILLHCLVLRHFGQSQYDLEDRVSLIDAKYHQAMLWYHFVFFSYSLMISFYEVQVEQYASAVHHFEMFLGSIVQCLCHDIIWTSSRIHIELKRHGIDARNISPESFDPLSDSSSRTSLFPADEEIGESTLQ